MEILVTINDTSHFLNYDVPHVVRTCFTVNGSYSVGRLHRLKSGECVDLVDTIARLFGIQQTDFRIDKVERWIVKSSGELATKDVPGTNTKHKRSAAAKRQKVKSFEKSIPDSLGVANVRH